MVIDPEGLILRFHKASRMSACLLAADGQKVGQLTKEVRSQAFPGPWIPACQCTDIGEHRCANQSNLASRLDNQPNMKGSFERYGSF